MQQPLLLSDNKHPDLLSLDAHVNNAAQGQLIIFRVSSESLHPRVFPGDVLLVDDLGPHYEYDELAMLVFIFDGQYLMRQKKFIAANLQRAKLHAVGSEPTHGIHVIGRLIGWLSAV